MTQPPTSDTLSTESDVEQKFLFPLLTQPVPSGCGFTAAEIFTKPDIRALKIDKGDSGKLYYPDHVVVVAGVPLLIVEVKKPSESLVSAAREARLYATELNAQYPPGINPCRYCLVSNGIETVLRSFDSETVEIRFSLSDVSTVSPDYGAFINKVKADTLRTLAAEVCAKLRPPRYFRALNLAGGRTSQNEQVPPNDFGRVLASNFQTIFDPASYDDRRKIVTDAYIGSPRKQRFASDIDRVIRQAAPIVAAEAQLIEDVSNPVELTAHLENLASLRNQILLLVGMVGSGKSTFVDYVRETVLSPDLRDHTAWVRIDLNPAPLTPNEIYSWIRQQIIDGIRAATPDIDTQSLNGLKSLYRKQVSKLEAVEGEIFGTDSPEYRSKLSELLTTLRADETTTIRCLESLLCTGRGRLLIIVLDNCDKRDRDSQLLMFQVAKYVQNEIRCLVILPIRHSTFENHRHEPPLDTALKDLVFRIEPPPFQEVLSARLNLVIREAKKLGPKKLRYHMGSATVELQIDRLERFLRAMMGALFEHRQYGRKIITGLAGWNIRKAFEIFLEFCRSGFIRDEDIFQNQASSGKLENLSHGVVAKILLRTNKRFYNGDDSYIKNIFQVDPSSTFPFQLLRYWILAWLRSKNTLVGPNGYKGYHKLGLLVTELVALGADGDAIRSECKYLANAGCIIPEHLKSDSISDDDLIAITPAGHVHLELAYQDINYLAACAEDSWVTDIDLAEAVRRRITQQPIHNALSWRNTLDSASDMCAYLDKIQSSTGTRSPFVDSAAFSPPKIVFSQMLQQIEGMQSNQRGPRAVPRRPSGQYRNQT